MSAPPTIKFRNYRPIDGSLLRFCVARSTPDVGVDTTTVMSGEGPTDAFLAALDEHAGENNKQRDLDAVLGKWDGILRERMERKLVAMVQKE